MLHVVVIVSKTDFFTTLCQTIGKEISSLGPAIAKAILTNFHEITMAIERNMSQVNLVSIIIILHTTNVSYFASFQISTLQTLAYFQNALTF